MAHAYHHACSSVRKWGGKPEDYLPIHNWFDASKAHLADIRHRALRHHTEGIFWAEEVFGPTITNSDGKEVPTRWIGEQHVMEDLGRIPTMADWFRAIIATPWMIGRVPLLPEDAELRGKHTNGSEGEEKEDDTGSGKPGGNGRT